MKDMELDFKAIGNVGIIGGVQEKGEGARKALSPSIDVDQRHAASRKAGKKYSPLGSFGYHSVLFGWGHGREI